MEIVKGCVVKAKAGRDKNGYFVVLDLDGEYAMISDGKRRPLEKPKRKKYKSYCDNKKCTYSRF